MKKIIKKLGGITLVILIISFVITINVMKTTSQSFFETFPRILIITFILGGVIWFIYSSLSKFYQIKESEITNRDEFIREIDEDLENVECYEKEDFGALKEEITNIRQKIESFIWEPEWHQEQRSIYGTGYWKNWQKNVKKWKK